MRALDDTNLSPVSSVSDLILFTKNFFPDFQRWRRISESYVRSIWLVPVAKFLDYFSGPACQISASWRVQFVKKP